MGAAAESVTFEKDTPAKSAEAGAQQTAPASSAFDPFVQRLFGGGPPDPPDSVADSLSIQRFRAPVLQRAQRLYGNRASQQIVQRAQVLQRKCACGGTCYKCQEEEQQRQDQHQAPSSSLSPVQRSSASPAPAQFDGVPASTGEQLDPSTRLPMEAQFGADLADVRVHTGSEAANSATSLDALAYTTGRDIYFAAGMYAPFSDSGRRLLAHEVAHVVQQSSGKEPTLATKSSHGAKIGAPDDPLEAEADRAAEEFMTGPLTDDEEERKKGESSVPVQRFIQRQGQPPSGSPVNTGQAPPQNSSTSTTPNETLTCEAEVPGVCTAGDKQVPERTPEPGPQSILFGGYTLSPRPDYLRFVLGQIGKADGFERMEWYVGALESGKVLGVDTSGAGEGAGAEYHPYTAYTPEQLKLLSEIAPVMRSELSRLTADYQAFGSFVRNAAVVRLTHNHQNLGLWRVYVLSLAPAQVMGMAVAQKEKPIAEAFLNSQAKGPFDPMEIYEQYSWSHSQHMRDYYERLATGKIHCGSEQCHEAIRAQDLDYHFPTMGEGAVPLAMRLPRYAVENISTPSPSKETAGQQEQEPASPGALVSTMSNRPGSQAVATSLNQIHDYIMPLGKAGYGVISDSIVKDATNGSQLVNNVIAAIDDRRQGFLDLKAKVGLPSYDFLKLQEILQELLPYADAEVRALVEGLLRQRREEKEAESTGGYIVGIAALLLTIFPPTAPIGLALGAGLALAGLASGYGDFKQGREFDMGTGAGVFTREQTDAGRAMQAMGIITMALSAFAIVDAGLGGVRLLRAPASSAAGAAEEIVGAEAASGEVQVQIKGLDGPSPMVKVTKSDGTIELFTVDDLEATASKAESGGAAASTSSEVAGAGEKVQPANPGEARILEAGSGDAIPSAEQIDSELSIVERSPTTKLPNGEEAVELPNGHSWRRSADGKWCRHSATICVPAGAKRVSTGNITSEKDIDKLIEPSRPHIDHPPRSVKTPEDQSLWEMYNQYFEERVGNIRADIRETGQTSREVPRDFASFRKAYTDNPNLLVALRGRLSQGQTGAIISDITSGKVAQNLGFSRVPNPGPGEIVYPDFVWRGGKGFTAVSQKARDFRGLSRLEVKKLVQRDIDEALEKYYGSGFVRRSGLDLTGQPIEIDEVILNYDVRLLPEDEEKLADIFAYGKDYGGGGVDITTDFKLQP